MSWPTARAEADLGMADETGRGGARVSAAAAVEGSDVGGWPTCCVCMEPWTDGGAHRICCIPCGHIYGRSCLESWLCRCRSNSAKCPQCGEPFAFKHIINLYAPGYLGGRYACTRCHIQFDSSSQRDKKGLFSSQALVTSGPIGSESDLCKQVLDILHEPANIEKEDGAHFDEIVKRLKLPERNIWDAITKLVENGDIYNTIDDFHFKSSINDWLPSVQETNQERVLTFQALLEEERRLREEMAARMEADRQRMEWMFQWMRSLAERMGQPPPPMLFPALPPPATTHAPVTSGPSGSENVLSKQVLDILREPASIEKEHGLHLEEITRRFNLPKRDILQAIDYQVYLGNVYTTIDDFHFMAI